jgi:N-acyl-D-amino-acid deacylase
MTLLIKSVRILDANQNLPELADVFISGEKISAIGSFPNKKADEIIDGQGAYLAPGFIDVYTESDHTLDLLRHPSQEDFLRQGVTTIIGGQGGISLAPLLYGSLESTEERTDDRSVNIHWHTLKEMTDIMSKKKLGVNFATLIGHTTLRRAIVGEELRPLTKNELMVFERLLSRTLKEGGFGLSTDLNSAYGKPATNREIKSLVGIVEKYNGVYAGYAKKKAHPKLSDSVEEIIKTTGEIGAKTLLNDFGPVKGAEEEYENALDKIENLPSSYDFRFTISPNEASLTPLYRFLPEWAENGGFDVMNKNLKDEWLQKRILEELPAVNPIDFIIARTIEVDSIAGRSLKNFMEFYGIRDAKKALLKLMITTKLRALVLYRDIDWELAKKAIKHPASFIASREWSPRFRAAATPPAFPRFLSLVANENLIPLDVAIRKITTEPAKFFGIKDRGEIKEGYFADLTGFKGEEIKFTVVNGRVAVKEGIFQNILAGKPLKHGS